MNNRLIGTSISIRLEDKTQVENKMVAFIFLFMLEEHGDAHHFVMVTPTLPVGTRAYITYDHPTA